ncbi:hypothetical protein RUM43_004238 [Polyplax serrata]|uniref:beta-N-acetylhexosaminidase n=1 Tax=Polyplax serrata TaxID=468196 RepID=A0AAN8SBP5_POLSC
MSSINNHRLVHLDLKGGPPKPDYLKNLYPLFVKWGATGLIIEWEDCFPFKGDFEVLSNKVYSTDNANQILQDAKDAKLEVIPLFQTFGHLEFVLKHQNYVQYREVPLFPSSMCPSHPDAINLVTTLLEQIINFHVGLKFVHIGADEVWHMGLCEKCKNRLENGEAKEDLYLKHIKKVVEFVKHNWPDINVIMWDDMLRDMDESTLYSYNLKSLVEPMIWHYNPAETFNLPPEVIRKYSYFDNVWVAGAFKGATGGSQLLPVVNHHASNILHWMCIINQLKTNYRGIALTGWSRYDHFSVLCELLPTGLPSLGVCLLIVEEKNFDATTTARIEADLGYTNEVTSLIRLSNVPFTFTYLGWEILSGISKFMNVRQSVNSALSCEQLESWMNPWQVSKGMVNPMQLVTLVPVLNMYLGELNDLEKFLQCHMSQILYEQTVEEWIGTYIAPLVKKLQSVIQTAEEQIAKSSKFVDEALKLVKKIMCAI